MPRFRPPFRTARVLCGLALGLLFASTLSDCREPTQVVLEITTDIACGDNPETGIAVGRASDYETRPLSTTTHQCTPRRIGSLVVVPGASNNGELAIRVVNGMTRSAQDCIDSGYKGGCVVARRILGFVPHETLHLPIFLEASCIDVPCDATQTCRHGSCVSAVIGRPSDCASDAGCDIEAGGAPGNSGGSANFAGEGSATGVGGGAGGELVAAGASPSAGQATGGSSFSAAGAGGNDAGLAGSAASGGGAGGAGMIEPTIDATEVTRAAYAAWLATSPPTAGQPSYCAFNTDFKPNGACPWPPTNDGTSPVACVDWCDARAYCEAHGRRLCGKPGGGATPWSSFADPSQSEWFATCTSGGQFAYTYGNAYAAAACNGTTSSAKPVGSLASCQSPDPSYAGIYDLTGNVFEWEDSCDGATDQSDACRFRGGDFSSSKTELRCDIDAFASRGYNLDPGVGFRCCAR